MPAPKPDDLYQEACKLAKAGLGREGIAVRLKGISERDLRMAVFGKAHVRAWEEARKS